MLSLRKNVRISHLVIAGYVTGLLLLLSMCDRHERNNDSSRVVHVSGKQFAGSEACMECHQAISESHRQTPHYLTSGVAADETVAGRFDSAKNVVHLGERLKIVMTTTDAGLFQTGFADSIEIGRKPMDITIGSGRNGQTYLYWENNSLYQLPASYYAPWDMWCNSPGYPTDQVLFNRNVPARCLECHSTYFKATKSIGGLETFDPDQAILGVDCERCHGPAGDHVDFHRKHAGESQGRHIINPDRLSRERKLDNCALCHSGIRDNFLPSFAYVVGDNLDDYFFPDHAVDSGSALDVHGNQYGMLAASKCFKMTSMDCSSCHNVHVKETNKLELFSSRCMNCHSPQNNNFCTQPVVPGLVLAENCIDCHMPALPSRTVFLQAAATSKPTPFFIRTHFISTYREQVELFLKELEEENGRAK